MEHPYFVFAFEYQKVIFNVFAITTVFTFVLLSIGGLILSHRVAGPMYKFLNHMQQVAQGEAPKPLSFREHDYFQELVEPYNIIVDKKGFNAKDHNSITKKAQ